MSGYTPTRFKGTTAAQRFGGSSKNHVPQDGQNRTPEGRAHGNEAKRELEADKRSDPPPAPGATLDAHTLVQTLNEEAMRLLVKEKAVKAGKKIMKKPDPKQETLPAMQEGEKGVDMSGPSFTPGTKGGPLTIASVLGVPEEAKPPRRAPAKYDSFPLISTFDREDMDHARQLMEDDVEYAEQEAAIKKARDKIKKELGALAQIYHIQGGMRWGNYVTYYTPGKTRKTLSKTLLVEAGVPAEVVADCYEESKPWDEVRVKDVSKGDDDD